MNKKERTSNFTETTTSLNFYSRLYKTKADSRNSLSTKNDLTKVLNNYYSIFTNDFSLLSNFNKSSIIQFSKVVINFINSNKFYYTNDNCLDSSFYRSCLQTVMLSNNGLSVTDQDLIIIYIKQLIHILKNSSLIMKGDFIQIKSFSSNEEFYIELFNSFWHKTNWKSIFPSCPDTAETVWENRSFLVELLLESENTIKIDQFTAEFFSHFESSKKPLFLSSFLDFYFFTWLKKFNLIEYISGSYHESVSVKLTDAGRYLISRI